MRIVHAVERLRLVEGGVARCILDTVAILERRGHECRLLTEDGADLPANWSPSDRSRFRAIRHPRVPLGRLLIRDRRELRAWLRESDVVHVHMPWAPWLLQVADFAQRDGLATCISLHGMLDRWSMRQRGTKKRIQLAVAGRRVIERANAVHFTAQDEATQGLELVSPRQSEVIPCPIDLTPYRELPDADLARRRLGLPPDARGILYLSRIHPKKGLLCLVRAFAMLERQTPVELWIAGDEQDRQYAAEVRSEIDKLRISGRVRFLGHVHGREKLALYRAAEVLALPTAQENFGLVLFEAILCGTAVVTTDGVDARAELLESSGAIIAERDPASIAGALDAVLGRHSSDALVSGERARAWVLHWLDERRVGGALERMYETAVRSARGA